MEEWRPILGFEGSYEVSSSGRVRSLDRKRWSGKAWCITRGKILKHKYNNKGYPLVHLHYGGPSIGAKKHGTTLLVHRLVLQSFVGACPIGMEGCHDDGDPLNCVLGNLRWDTRSGNHNDRIRHGTHHRGERNPRAKLSDADVPRILDMRACGVLQKDIASWFGVCKTTIGNVLANKSFVRP